MASRFCGSMLESDNPSCCNINSTSPEKENTCEMWSLFEMPDNMSDLFNVCVGHFHIICIYNARHYLNTFRDFQVLGSFLSSRPVGNY